MLNHTVGYQASELQKRGSKTSNCMVTSADRLLKRILAGKYITTDDPAENSPATTWNWPNFLFRVRNVQSGRLFPVNYRMRLRAHFQFSLVLADGATLIIWMKSSMYSSLPTKAHQSEQAKRCTVQQYMLNWMK